MNGNVKEYGAFSSVVSAKPVPAAPAGVKAARVSSSNVKVSWGTVAGATKYELWRALSAAGTYTLVTATGVTSYTNKGLTAGKKYYYKVRVYRLVGGKKVYGGFSAVVYGKP
jgi:fibronectin type 3 domain-containing protein